MSVFLHRIGLLKPIPLQEYSCNMTAGDSGFFQGYDIGTPMGSIDAEPIPGETLKALVSGLVNGISFDGNVTSIVAGLTVWVDSVEYPFDSADWAYDSMDDETEAFWNTGGPVFVDTNTYFVEIK